MKVHKERKKRRIGHMKVHEKEERERERERIYIYIEKKKVRVSKGAPHG